MKRFAWFCLLVWAGMLGIAPTSTYAAAPYALEIIQPRPDLDTKNRFYKAYPGLVYNVRAAVIGGTYPFTYELTSAPADMTIDSFTGEMNWPSPAASGTPYPVSLKVTDTDGSVATVSWTITVTTNGFRFLDAVNGQRSALFGGTATGLIDKPWKTMEDMFEGSDLTAKNKSTYKNEFLYFKNGSYASPSWIVSGDLSSNKPLVWMAYPGEKPEIKGAFHITGQNHNFYLEGFDYNINGRAGIHVSQYLSNTGGVVIRKNVFHNLAFPVPYGPQYSSNDHAVFIDAEKAAIQDNVFHDIRHGYGIIGYDSSVRTLVENNLFYDFSSPSNASYAISPKAGIQMWFIRGNNLYNLNAPGYINGLNLQYENNNNSKDIEISYNLVRNGTSTILEASPSSTTGGKLYVHHNTFVGAVTNFGVGTDDGPFYYYNNVIVNNGEGTPAGSHVGQWQVTDPSRIVVSDNLGGYPTDNIVDAAGDLTSGYISYLGLRGHQLAGPRQAVPPAPPADTSIYTVTIAKSGTGAGTVTAADINCDLANTDCSASYLASDFITLTAVPDATSSFEGMVETCDFINPCRFRVNKNQTVTVKFKRVPPTASEAFPLEILQPKGGLNTTNRFYKAYPGLIYNVRAGVIGGKYPYKHELTAFPPGMTIDSFRGEITWPNPTIAGSPHSVSLKVTDQEGRSATVSWTITVTETGFRFLDAVNGQPSALFGGTGTGSISNPWKSLADVYEGDTTAAVYKKSYKDEFLYFKTGVYPHLPIGEIQSDHKPVVWMAYPGEKPVLEGPNKLMITDASVANNSNPYFEGFEFRNIGSYGFKLHGKTGSATVWKNEFHNLPASGCPDPVTGAGLANNESFIFLDMTNISIQDNIFRDIKCGDGIKGYDAARKVLIEDNTFHNIGLPEAGWGTSIAITPKAGIQEWFIRANHIYDVATGINFMHENNNATRDNEVSYNRVQIRPGKFPAFEARPHTLGGPMYIHHNTFVGAVSTYKMDALDGPFYFYNNVVVNESAGTPTGSHIGMTQGTAPERIIVTDHLPGYPADGIIDSNLRLQGRYRDPNDTLFSLGTRGWELGMTLPVPPKNLRIIP